MNGFYKEMEGIYRLKIPFEKIYTSVFLIEANETNVLVDCATTAEDVDNCVVPSLLERGHRLSDIGILVLTHRHDDHAGGLGRILTLAPDIEIVANVRRLGNTLTTYPMAGHSEDSIGVFDECTHTLISGDGLQGAGIDKYRSYPDNLSAYIETVERIMNDERIENILFSHAYEPWNKDLILGRNEVKVCLKDCLAYIK